MDALEERVLDAAEAAPSWRSGLCAALLTVSEEVAERPLYMRGLLVEVHVAGGPAPAKRAAVLETFADAMDRARHDSDSRQPPPPPLTSRFMVGAIDSAVCRALLRGKPEEFTEAVPALAQLVVGAYLGAQNANDPKELGMLLRA